MFVEQNPIIGIGSKWIKMVFMIFSLFISHLLHHHTFVPHEHKEHITNYKLDSSVQITNTRFHGIHGVLHNNVMIQ